MTGNGKNPVLVQLSGGNDFMNTVIPYANPIYYDKRPLVRIPQDQVLSMEDSEALGFHPSFGPVKELYDEGSVAIVQGIGYPNSNRSHFRGMDIWHTCRAGSGGSIEGLAGSGHPGIGPPRRECVDRRQHRPRPSPGYGGARESRSPRWATWSPTV